MSRLSIIVWATVTATLATHAQRACAQDSDKPVELDQVIVSARRVAEDLQKTPVAVTAITARQLEQRGVESLLDIGSVAPNVVAGSQSSTGTQSGGFFIRGIGQDRSGITFDQGVGLYVDDVYFSRSDSSLLSVVDVEDIEVLRGPQGTLFGKNSLGGAIRYTTAKPDESFNGYVDVTGGNYDRHDVKAVVNTPLSNTLFLRTTVGWLQRDGYIKEVVGKQTFGDQDTRIGREQLRWVPNDRLTVDLSFTATALDNNGRAFVVDGINSSAIYPQLLLSKTGQVYDDSYLTHDPYKIYGGRHVGYSFRGRVSSLAVDYHINDQTQLKSITAYMDNKSDFNNDYDGTNLPIFDYWAHTGTTQLSQEFQLNGTAFDNRLRYVAGLYYLKERPHDMTDTLTVYSSYFPGLRDIFQSSKVQSYAAYLQTTWSITDRLSATLGGRFSRDSKDVFAINYTIDSSGNGSRSWNDFSPRIDLEYQWTSDTMTYASVTRGFRSGGFNTTLASSSNKHSTLTSYDPEHVTNYEVGLRTTLAERLRLNATVFYMDYEDQQLTALNAVLNQIYIQNVGSSHMQGVELETQWAISRDFSLQGTMGLLQARYDDIGSATGITRNTTVLRAPRQTYSLAANYKTQAFGGVLAGTLSYSWTGRQTTTSTASNTVLLDSYGLLNARLEFRPGNSPWRFALLATNLTNQRYYIGGIDFATHETLIGTRTLDVGAPRQWGIQVRYQF